VYRSRNCNSDNWGVNVTTYGQDIDTCRPCPLGLVTSSNSTTYPVSSSYHVDNGDGSGGFISGLACVTQPGYGVYGTRGLPCPKGSYNRQDNYNNCTDCSPPLTTAGPGAGVTVADCGIPAAYGYHGGAVVLCPNGKRARPWSTLECIEDSMQGGVSVCPRSACCSPVCSLLGVEAQHMLSSTLLLQWYLQGTTTHVR